MNLSPEERIAGILLSLFALRTEDDIGIGDVAALKQFVDWAADNGFRLVQLLPINETGHDNSPYNAISSRRDRTDHIVPRARLTRRPDAGRSRCGFYDGRYRTNYAAAM